jgi:hypothetical protein
MREAAKHTPADVAAAEARAIAFLRYCLQNNLMLDGLEDPSIAEQAEQSYNDLINLYDDDLAKLFKMARKGDVDADRTLRDRILDEAGRGALTKEKHEVLNWLLLEHRPTLPRSRGRAELKNRNFIIASAVNRITALEFAPTRSRDRRDSVSSACQIVSKALKQLGLRTSERTVENIWNDNKNVVGRIWLHVPSVPLK